MKYKNNIIPNEPQKFKRTSQSTCYNQKVLVGMGQKVQIGDVLVEAPAAENGELALGIEFSYCIHEL